MFDLVPFTGKYAAPKFWDPFKEFFSSASRAAATDIRETDEAFLIEMELPGFDKSEISVSMKESVLTIRAEHAAEKASDDGYIRRERVWETTERSFDVSGVDTEHIAAAFVNGLLTVTLPKLPEVIPQQTRIEIQ